MHLNAEGFCIYLHSDPMFQSCHHVSTVPGQSWAQCLAGRLLGLCAAALHPLKHNPGLLGGITSGISPQGGHSGALDGWLKRKKQHVLLGRKNSLAGDLCARRVHASPPLKKGNVMWWQVKGLDPLQPLWASSQGCSSMFLPCIN